MSKILKDQKYIFKIQNTKPRMNGYHNKQSLKKNMKIYKKYT